LIYFVFFRVVLTGPGSRTVGARWRRSRGRFSSRRSLPLRTGIDVCWLLLVLYRSDSTNLAESNSVPSRS